MITDNIFSKRNQENRTEEYNLDYKYRYPHPY